jgi:hypothetical protein
VAENGIPFSLINRAKKKIEVGKVRFDKTIATLQKERKWKKLRRCSRKKKPKRTRRKEDGTINIKIKQKLESIKSCMIVTKKLLRWSKDEDIIIDISTIK